MMMTTQPNIHKIEQMSCEEVLFNSDTLSKIISYLPSVGVLNLALTCKRFGISDDEKLSVIKKSARITIQDLATEEQLAALPCYDGDSTLADYHYLQLMREPLVFDQFVGAAGCVNNMDKSCMDIQGGFELATAFSNNIQEQENITHCSAFSVVGVM